MAADVLNVQLGVCTITVRAAGEAVPTDLGHTIGGAEVIYTPEYHETKVDKYTGIAERFLISEKFGAKVQLAESILAVIRKAITYASQTGTKATIGSYAGKRASDRVVEVVLHPIANADSDRSEDVVIYRAHATNEITMPFTNEGERVMEVMLEGMIDETKTDGNLLGLIGDSTA